MDCCIYEMAAVESAIVPCWFCDVKGVVKCTKPGTKNSAGNLAV